MAVKKKKRSGNPPYERFSGSFSVFFVIASETAHDRTDLLQLGQNLPGCFGILRFFDIDKKHKLKIFARNGDALYFQQIDILLRK